MPRATANAVSVPTTAQIASNVIILPSALPTDAAWSASFDFLGSLSLYAAADLASCQLGEVSWLTPDNVAAAVCDPARLTSSAAISLMFIR